MIHQLTVVGSFSHHVRRWATIPAAIALARVAAHAASRVRTRRRSTATSAAWWEGVTMRRSTEAFARRTVGPWSVSSRTHWGTMEAVPRQRTSRTAWTHRPSPAVSVAIRTAATTAATERRRRTTASHHRSTPSKVARRASSWPTTSKVAATAKVATTSKVSAASKAARATGKAAVRGRTPSTTAKVAATSKVAGRTAAWAFSSTKPTHWTATAARAHGAAALEVRSTAIAVAPLKRRWRPRASARRYIIVISPWRTPTATTEAAWTAGKPTTATSTSSSPSAPIKRRRSAVTS